jgi:hypothetical protein
MPNIPIYPEGGIRQPDGSESIAATVEDLQVAINSHGQVHGYALNRRCAANYKDGKPTRWVLRCDRYGKPRSSEANTRTTTTEKTGCEFEGIARLNKVTEG